MSIRGNWEKRRVEPVSFLGEIDRRTFVKLSGASAAALILGFGPYTRKAASQTTPSSYPFTLGVASGDPTPDGVVIWTRLAPDPLAEDGHGGMPPNRMAEVRYEVATDESFNNVVRSGTVNARPELAHSVHVEVEGLQPGREYYYRFMAGSYTSDDPLGPGRTKTAPGQGSLDSVTFAFASCQMYEHGFYNAYYDMVQESQSLLGKDLDFVLHLGDYIYEYEPITGYPARGGGNIRTHQPADETDRLREYRVRHAQYKHENPADVTDTTVTLPSTIQYLQEAHRLFPFIVTFDDHEVENNYADAIDEQDSSDPDRERKKEFLKRRQAAYRAYYEHMPLRRTSMPRGPDMRLYRRLTYGNIAEFNVLDTRQYRDDQAQDDGLDPPNKATRNPRRTLTGDRQEQWLFDGLVASNAKWNVLAQQLVFSQLDLNPEPNAELYNMDQWDGYEGQRDRIVRFLEERNVSNPMVLTGDIHLNFANDIKRNFDDESSPTVGTEYVGTSVTSDGEGTGATSPTFPDNPHIKFVNDTRGYVRCTLDPEQWQTEYRAVSVKAPASLATTIATFVTQDGQPGAQPTAAIPETNLDQLPDIIRDRIEAQQGPQ